MPTSAPNYVNVPPLKDYINRIGAEELNFRKFIVRLYRGSHYYHERCIIKINNDCSITCSHSEYAPTDQEASDIQAALLRCEYPTHVKATPAQFRALQQTLGPQALLYAFVDRFANPNEGNVVMVQERTLIDGKKNYLPWSMWSDAEWRRMEGDGPLPFWKPLQRVNSSQFIMIHEGAKTAHYVHELTTNPAMKEELNKHPWGEELVKYEHWGMIGGALAPQRTNYAELIREKASEIIYVCDNDWPGKSALKIVSKCFGHQMKGVMFDERWPVAWDLADEMPASMFGDDGKWKGPTLLHQTQPATWATEIAERSTPGRPTTQVRSEFAEEWVHCVSPEVFIHIDWPSRIYTASEFNHVVRPFSSVDDTARLLKTEAANRSALLQYSPPFKSGIYNADDGTRFINTHTGTTIKPPIPLPQLRDAEPWLDFMHYLIPDEADCTEMLRWVATIVARLDIKMLYCPLLVSEVQGIGKSTLGEKILAPLIGLGNVSFPSENDIVESNFNYWAAHKRLAIVHEIYAGHSAKAYNKLKSIITDKVLPINKKYQASYEIDNWMHIFACSNSSRALQLSTDDRRWFVPKVTIIKRPAEYWVGFNNWLVNKSGLKIVKWWCDEWLKTNPPVISGASAPWSQAKKEVIEEGYSPGQVLVSQFLERAKEALKPTEFMLDVDLCKLVQDQIYEGRQNDRIEKPATVRKLAKAGGWHIGERKVRIFDWGLRHHTARIIALDPELAAMEPGELNRNGRKPFDVCGAAQRWVSL